MEHPILKTVYELNKEYASEQDAIDAPTDPQEFLDWWWTTKAKICERCILSERRTTVVKPDGLASAKIMVLGEGPGMLEDLSAIPMVGPLELRGSRCGLCSNSKGCYSHKMLAEPDSRSQKNKVINCEPNFVGKLTIRNNFYLRSAGSIVDGMLIDKYKFAYPRQNWINFHNQNNPDQPWEHESPFFFSNSTLCRTTDATGLKDQPPDSVPRRMCKYHLAYQYAAVQPKIIICLGKVMLGVLLGAESKADLVSANEIVDSKFGPVIFNYHPAAAMRNPNNESKGLEFAKLVLTFEKALEYAGYQI